MRSRSGPLPSRSAPVAERHFSLGLSDILPEVCSQLLCARPGVVMDNFLSKILRLRVNAPREASNTIARARRGARQVGSGWPAVDLPSHPVYCVDARKEE